jgi:DNA-binding GntR family transcriptional regulator
MNVSKADERAATALLQSEPLHLLATKQLRTMIIDGALAPGTAIDERQLCQQFGTSRTPLREALKVLASEGLIELLPRRGAIVAHLSPQDMREKFAVVRVLEAYAASTVCASATDEQIEALQAIHAQLLAAHKKRNAATYFELNEKFHRQVVAATGNKTLVDMHSALVVHLRRARFTVLSAHTMLPQFVKDHERIMKAITARNGEAAAAEFMKHQAAIEQETISFFTKRDAAPGGTLTPKHP